MSETDSPLNHRTSPGSQVSKPDSLLNLVIPSRTTQCQKQIPVENRRTSLGFPSLLKQIHY